MAAARSPLEPCFLRSLMFTRCFHLHRKRELLRRRMRLRPTGSKSLLAGLLSRRIGRPKFRPQLERSANRPVPVVRFDTKVGDRSLDVMRWGPNALLGQGHQSRLLEQQRKGRRDREQARLPRGIPAAAVPYAFALADRRLKALAGLWETWRLPAGERVHSFAITTTTPNELCAELHDRMPVILGPDVWPEWLGEEPAEQARFGALHPTRLRR
jgi:SOS response associated peptidase (SRAP)